MLQRPPRVGGVTNETLEGVPQQRPTHNKRQREQKLIQKRKDKAARLQEAHAARDAQRQNVKPGEDPALAGIKAGPQPSPWADFMPASDLPQADDDTE